MTKITKKDYYTGLINYLNGDPCEVSIDDMVAFCETQINALNTQAMKAKERAAAKKAEADPIIDAVYAVLTDEYQTIAEVAEAVAMNQTDDEEPISVAKCTSRLTKLFNAGMVEKEQVSVEIDGSKAKRMGYRLAANVEE